MSPQNGPQTPGSKKKRGPNQVSFLLKRDTTHIDAAAAATANMCPTDWIPFVHIKKITHLLRRLAYGPRRRGCWLSAFQRIAFKL